MAVMTDKFISRDIIRDSDGDAGELSQHQKRCGRESVKWRKQNRIGIMGEKMDEDIIRYKGQRVWWWYKCGKTSVGLLIRKMSVM